jgi:transcriptional regulator with XRE-family HTH domain
MLREDQIGLRIRKLRLERNLTQQQLADEAGLTKGYLSKIENSKSAPPVSTLINLSKALGVNIDAFFSKEIPSTSYTLVKKSDRLAMARQGASFGYSYEHLAPKFPNRQMDPFILTILPEVEHTDKFQHKGQELFLILEGRVSFVIGEEQLVLEEGDCLYFDSGIPHSGRALDNKAVRFLIVIYSGDIKSL